METIEARLATLERRNHRYRLLIRALVPVVVAGLSAAYCSARIPEVIRAHSFEVVNRAGKTILPAIYVPSGICPSGDDGGMICLFK